MILPDVNVLVHAHNTESPVHERACQWWNGRLAGNVGIGLAWVTMLGFLRITTHSRILTSPLAADTVLTRLESWLSLPHVHIPQPSDRHFSQLRDCLGRLGTAGNLTTDAHLATLALDRGYTVYTTDKDFARFPGLRWINPCVEAKL